MQREWLARVETSAWPRHGRTCITAVAEPVEHPSRQKLTLYGLTYCVLGTRFWHPVEQKGSDLGTDDSAIFARYHTAVSIEPQWDQDMLKRLAGRWHARLVASPLCLDHHRSSFPEASRLENQICIPHDELFCLLEEYDSLQPPQSQAWILTMIETRTVHPGGIRAVCWLPERRLRAMWSFKPSGCDESQISLRNRNPGCHVFRGVDPACCALGLLTESEPMDCLRAS